MILIIIQSLGRFYDATTITIMYLQQDLTGTRALICPSLPRSRYDFCGGIGKTILLLDSPIVGGRCHMSSLSQTGQQWRRYHWCSGRRRQLSDGPAVGAPRGAAGPLVSCWSRRLGSITHRTRLIV